MKLLKSSPLIDAYETLVLLKCMLTLKVLIPFNTQQSFTLFENKYRKILQDEN